MLLLLLPGELGERRGEDVAAAALLLLPTFTLLLLPTFTLLLLPTVLLSSGTLVRCAAPAPPSAALPPPLKNFPTPFGTLPRADKPLRTTSHVTVG